MKKQDGDPEITAQPRSISEQLVSAPIAEQGLSIDPEDLGRQFLSGAMEQANFESEFGSDASEIAITEGPLTDAALFGPSWEVGGMWERTINLSLQEGNLSDSQPDDMDEDEKQEEMSRELAGEAHEVDLTSSSIYDGSLLDYETDVLGDVASPRVDTDEAADTERRRKAAQEELESTLPSAALRPRPWRRAAGAR